ncbi:MAG: DinB family protein [Dehalococcoidia bacterium]
MPPRFAPEHDETRWLLKALRETAHELESQLWDLDEDGLRWRPSDGSWSLKEIAAHLRDCEEHFLHSLELIASQEAPRIPSFDADALVLERDYREIDLYEVLERFAYLRHRTVNLLWSLMPEDWERTGSHPYLGPVSIARLAREHNEHGLEHLWQARRLRQALAEHAPSSH